MRVQQSNKSRKSSYIYTCNKICILGCSSNDNKLFRRSDSFIIIIIEFSSSSLMMEQTCSLSMYIMHEVLGW